MKIKISFKVELLKHWTQTTIADFGFGIKIKNTLYKKGKNNPFKDIFKINNYQFVIKILKTVT